MYKAAYFCQNLQLLRHFFAMLSLENCIIIPFLSALKDNIQVMQKSFLLTHLTSKIIFLWSYCRSLNISNGYQSTSPRSGPCPGSWRKVSSWAPARVWVQWWTKPWHEKRVYPCPEMPQGLVWPTFRSLIQRHFNSGQIPHHLEGTAAKKHLSIQSIQ